ncbi:MAG: hypothetical protein ACK5A1_08825, partial [Planctomyces sp.]
MYAVLLILLFTLLCDSTAAADGQTRPSPSDQQLQFWLQNMVWHHRYSTAEICQVTGLSSAVALMADHCLPPELQLLFAGGWSSLNVGGSGRVTHQGEE